MSRKGRPNYVVVHYHLNPKSSFTETYSTAKEAIEAMHMFTGTDGMGYSEITCTLNGKKGARPWGHKRISWKRILDPKFSNKVNLNDLSEPVQLGLIGFVLPVASQENEHGLPSSL